MIFQTYCINLDERKDRWYECEAEFKRIGWTVERFPGIKGDFNRTQLECIRLASKHSSSLILEDDVEFREMDHLESAYNSLPEDWDIFFLGATVKREHREKVSEHLYRYVDGWATHAVAYSQKMMLWLVENFDPEGLIYDEWLRIYVLQQFKCYIIKPLVCYQRPSYSDIQGKFADYTGGFEEGEKFLI